MFFVVWIAGSLAAWVVIAVGNAAHRVEMRRRQEGNDTARLILGRGFLLPGIAFGLAAFALPLLAMVQGIELLETVNPDISNQLPDWVFVVIAGGLIVGLFFSIGLGAFAAPRIFAQRVLIVSPTALELKNRFTRRTIAHIYTDQPYEHSIEHYAVQSGENVQIIYTHYDELTFTQGEHSLRVQVRGETNKEHAPMLPPRAVPNRIHHDRDVDLFKKAFPTLFDKA